MDKYDSYVTMTLTINIINEFVRKYTISTKEYRDDTALTIGAG